MTSSNRKQQQTDISPLPQIVKGLGYAIDGWYEDPEFTIPFDANNVTKRCNNLRKMG